MIFTACNRQERELAREKAEMDAQMEGLSLDIYRGFKLSIRSLPDADLFTDGLKEGQLEKRLQSAQKDLPAVKMYAFGVHALKLMTGKESEFGIWDYLMFARELHDLRQTIRTLDEDMYPTIFEKAWLVNGKGAFSQEYSWYTKDFEHLLLTSMAYAMDLGEGTIALYEFREMDPTGIPEPRARMLGHFLKGAYFFNQGWNWHAEESAQEYLDFLKLHPGVALQSEFNFCPGATVESPEQKIAQFRAPGLVLRACARQKSGRNRGARKDFAAFQKDCQVMQWESELVWLAGLWLALDAHELPTANALLDKLAQEEGVTWGKEGHFKKVKRIAANEPDSAKKLLISNQLVARYLFNLGYVFLRESAKGFWEKGEDFKFFKAVQEKGIGQIPEYLQRIHSFFDGEGIVHSLDESFESIKKNVEGEFQGWWDIGPPHAVPQPPGSE